MVFAPLKQRRSGKKGQMTLGDLPASIMLVMLALLIGGVSLIVLTQFQSSVDGDADFNNTIGKGTDTISNIFDLMPLAGTILVLAIIIGLIIFAFGGFMRRQSGGL